MKKSHAITLALVVIVVAGFVLCSMLKLDLAKRRAISKFSSDDCRVLNCVPFSSVVSIPHSEPDSGYLFAQPPGCQVGLPDSEFKRDPAHPIVFLLVLKE